MIIVMECRIINNHHLTKLNSYTTAKPYDPPGLLLYNITYR